jgi:hypothetical protein
MNAIQKRQLAKLVYVAPEPLLEKNSSIVDEITRGSEAVRHFTGSQKKKYLEEYQAGFLAFMLKHILAKQMTGLYVEITVHTEEFEDCDCVIKRIVGGNPAEYRLVQLKQLPNHATNNQIELQTIIDGLQNKYKDRIVAIWVNRDIQIDLSKLKLDGLTVEQLWFFGVSATEGITLHGGHIPDLKSGCWLVGKMVNGKPQSGMIKVE